MRVTVHNRGPDAARLHVLPQIWFRNTWSWTPDRKSRRSDWRGDADRGQPSGARHVFPAVPTRHLTQLLFCDNESNAASTLERQQPRRVISRMHSTMRSCTAVRDAVNPCAEGTKAAAWYVLDVPAGGSAQVRAAPVEETARADHFADFDSIFATRMREADEFYAELQQGMESADARAVQRQAFAGMIWSKQFFYFDIPEWLDGDPTQPAPPAGRKSGRNRDWAHLNNADIISMPDKWEYPWYAAWDLAFHCIPLAHVDSEFAKEQLVLLTREWYMHPNGQIPAYEWAFGDVNPPVHAWATWRVFQIDRKQRGGHGDLEFLERVFHKLMLNFTWWVNRKDAEGRNVFQGGFLGLDNIGVFDRSAQLPTGGHIDQADGTSWMAMYSLNLMRIALELAQHNHVYEDIATKFFEHFLHIAEAMSNIGERGRRPLGRRRQVLLRRAASARRRDDSAQGALDGRADSAVRGGSAGARAAGEGAGVRASGWSGS